MVRIKVNVSHRFRPLTTMSGEFEDGRRPPKPRGRLYVRYALQDCIRWGATQTSGRNPYADVNSWLELPHASW